MRGRGRKIAKRRVPGRLFAKLGFIVAAIVLALVPLPAAIIERYYSNAAFPIFQSGLTSITNVTRAPLGEVLAVAILAGLATWSMVRLKRARGRRLKAAGLLLFDIVLAAAILYIAFLTLWGFNYQREPLMRKLDYDDSRLSETSEHELWLSNIKRMNADSRLAHEEAWPADEEWREQLFDTLKSVVVDLGNQTGIVEAIPKTSIADRFLGATGVSGYTNPFGLEVILNSDLLPVERPFTLAHEWGHLAGFADESEANFVALLACARSEIPAIRYSAWLAIYPYLPLPRALAERLAKGEKREEILPQLAPEVVADLRAIAERTKRRVSPAISRMQGRVYDSFLKVNRVEAGIESYGLIVRLMLGTRFKDEWVPARCGNGLSY